jgi:hypothetical protein
MTSIKKIGNGALKTLGWLTFPGLIAARKSYNEKVASGEYTNSEYDDFGDWTYEIPKFLGITALSFVSVLGINMGYEKLANKEYSDMSHSINITVKPNSSQGHNFLYYASAICPPVKLALIGTSDDITSIGIDWKLKMQMANKNLIQFDSNNGFSLNKEVYYNNNFKLKEDDKWVEYKQDKAQKINSEYKKLMKQSLKIKEKVIRNGNVGLITDLENKINKLQGDYEHQRAAIKQKQIEVEKELTEMIDRLNKEYFAYKNAPQDTAIPIRDYDLSNITK